MPLEKFIHESIVDPDAYIEKGYAKGVMPTTFKSLPKSTLDALVAFLALRREVAQPLRTTSRPVRRGSLPNLYVPASRSSRQVTLPVNFLLVLRFTPEPTRWKFRVRERSATVSL